MNELEKALFHQAANARNTLYLIIGALSATKLARLVPEMALYETADGLSEALNAYCGVSGADTRNECSGAPSGAEATHPAAEDNGEPADGR